MSASRLLLFAIPVVAFLSPVYLAFVTLDLPHDAQAIGVAAAIMLVAVTLGLVAAALHSDNAGLLRSMTLAGILGLTALLTADLALYSQNGSLLNSGRAPIYGMILLLWACLSAAFWLLRRHAPKILFIGVLATLVSTVLTGPGSLLLNLGRVHEAPQITNGDAPPTIYIVLDEMIGPEGIPRDIAGGEETYRRVLDLFERHGFRLYGRAFSRHVKSARSIPNTLNFDDTDESWGTYLRYASDDVVQSSLLSQLATAHPLTVYQTDHIDFCGAAVERCETLASFHVHNGYATDLHIGSGAQLQILRQATDGSALSSAVVDLLAAASTLDVRDPELPDYFDNFAFVRWFDRFADDVVSSRGDENFFAHILAPHAPYRLSATCEGIDRWEWPYQLNEKYRLTGPVLDRVRIQQYGWYFEQVQCVINRLDAMLTRIETTPGLERATIVLHGDHGSRISSGWNAEALSDRDLIDNYSALYAIRGDNIEPGYDERIVSVQRLTAEYFDPAIAAEDPDLIGTVVIDTAKDGEVIRRSLPATFLSQ